MRRRSVRRFVPPVPLLSLLAAVAAAPPAAGADLTTRADPAAQIEAGRRATVYVTVDSPDVRGTGTGTGFCIDSSGLFVTNDHVVTMKGKAVRDRLLRVEPQAGEFDRGLAALAKLAADPNDPEANLAAGRYHCFVRGEYDKGLALLAKGRDALLRAIAAADLAAPTTADARKALGDLWWEQASRETANRAAAERCRERAANWYRIAEPGLTGLARVSIRERLATLAPPPTTRPAVPGDGPPPAAPPVAVRRPRAEADKPARPPAAGAVPTPTAMVGGRGGDVFEDVAPAGGVLVGLAVFTTGGDRLVNRVQPVFATARDGYAVGGLIVRTGGRIDGLAVVFMRRAGDGLDPDDAYVSDWVGGEGGDDEKLGDTGDPVIGLCGRSGNWIDAVGLVVATPPKR